MRAVVVGDAFVQTLPSDDPGPQPAVSSTPVVETMSIPVVQEEIETIETVDIVSDPDVTTEVVVLDDQSEEVSTPDVTSNDDLC